MVIASRSDGSVTDDHVWDAVTGRMESWNTTDPAGNTTRSFEYDGAGRLRWMERKEGSSAPVETELFYDVDDNVVLERRGSDEIRRFQGSRWDANGAVETVLPQVRVVTDPAGRMALHYAYVDVDGQAVSVFGSNGSLVSTEVTGAYGVPLQGAPLDYASSPEAWVVDGLHGQEEDRGNEVSHFGARHTLFRDGMWMQPEPLLGTPKAVSFVGRPGASGSVYAGGNPVWMEDREGQYAESFIEIVSIGIGLNSMSTNLQGGDYGAAALDAAGIVVDVAALAVPGIPGGAGAGIKAGRMAERAGDLASGANKLDGVLDAGKGAKGAPKQGIYEFPDQAAGGTPYVGQSGNIPKRLKQHEKAGRLDPGTEATTGPRWEDQARDRRAQADPGEDWRCPGSQVRRRIQQGRSHWPEAARPTR